MGSWRGAFSAKRASATTCGSGTRWRDARRTHRRARRKANLAPAAASPFPAWCRGQQRQRCVTYRRAARHEPRLCGALAVGQRQPDASSGALLATPTRCSNGAERLPANSGELKCLVCVSWRPACWRSAFLERSCTTVEGRGGSLLAYLFTSHLGRQLSVLDSGLGQPVSSACALYKPLGCNQRALSTTLLDLQSLVVLPVPAASPAVLPPAKKAAGSEKQRTACFTPRQGGLVHAAAPRDVENCCLYYLASACAAESSAVSGW